MRRTIPVVFLFSIAFWLTATQGGLEATSPAHAGSDGSAGGSSSTALPTGTSHDWWSQAQRQIAVAEYELTWQERPLVRGLAPSWHAPNRAHGFRTYFTANRGTETLGGVWSLLDLVPYGRQEKWEKSPAGWPQSAPYEWWRRHDEY